MCAGSAGKVMLKLTSLHSSSNAQESCPAAVTLSADVAVSLAQIKDIEAACSGAAAVP